MLPRTRPWLLLLATLLTSGCTALVQDAGTVEAPDPLEAIPTADCPVRSDAERLSAWRAGPARTGFLPCEGVPDAVELAFSVTGINEGDHTAAKASAVPVDGTWLVPGDTGSLHRVGPSGEMLWNASTSPSSFGIHGTPAVHDKTVYVGAYDGALYAFDLATGEQRWRTPLGGSIGASPVVHEEKVYIAVETAEPSGLVSIVDTTTGEEVFRDERVTDHPHSSIAIAPAADRFVVGANDGTLYAWNLTTREAVWTFPTDDAIKGPILVHDGAAFFGSWDDNVYRVDLDEGERAWAYETGGNVMGGAAVDPGTGTLYVGSFDDHLYALDADDGHLRWRTDLGGAVLSSPTIAGDTVLAGSYDEHLYALDARDGQPVWRYEVQGRVTSSAAVADGQVAFTERADEQAGRLYVLQGKVR